MTERDWFVSNEGQYEEWNPIHPPEDLTHPYRLYRLLTDLEDILLTESDDRLRLQAICPLVRRLSSSSPWIQLTDLEPDPETGWNVLTLYDEPFFPLTVQLVSWAPGTTSPIHNHATWGLVALLSGQEKNTFWHRSPTPEFADRIESVGELLLTSGDILCLMPDTIHQIEAMGERPTISLNLYGETDYNRRLEFDPIQGTATNF